MGLTLNQVRVSAFECGGFSLRSTIRDNWYLGLFAFAWLDLFRQLSYTWTTNEQYSYGWFVPLFVLYLAWRKWTDRPAPEPRRQSWWSIGLAGLATSGYLPIRMIHEANPDWPLI